MQWTDIFSVLTHHKVGNRADKTLAADQITWQGIFNGRIVCVVSTVRLVLGSLAHCTARIGAHSWDLPGGYYVDLVVASHDRLSDEDLLLVGQLAAAVDPRPIFVRHLGEELAEGRPVRAAGEGFRQPH